jgi:hypothetical protein
MTETEGIGADIREGERVLPAEGWRTQKSPDEESGRTLSTEKILSYPTDLGFQILKDVAGDALLGVDFQAIEKLILLLKVALERVFVLPRQFAQGERTVFSVCFGDHGEKVLAGKQRARFVLSGQGACHSGPAGLSFRYYNAHQI